MQMHKLLCPSTDLGGARLGSKECGMLVVLHELLLSHGVSERYIHLYRVSHLKAQFMRLLSTWEMRFCFSLKSATVVYTSSALNCTIDREKDVPCVFFLIQIRMLQVEEPAQRKIASLTQQHNR
jgi:hypothetical protein